MPLTGAAGSAILAGAVASLAWAAAPEPAVPAADTAAQATSPPAAQVPGSRPVAQASLDELLLAPPSPDWQWRRYQGNPEVLVIEFPSLREQGMTMNRLAAMFEKRGGRRDRLPTDAELARLLRRSGDSVGSFYQGHDYPGTELARFFTLAAIDTTRLNRQEMRLRELLVDTAVIRSAANGGYTAVGQQAVVSFTAARAGIAAVPPNEQVDPLRREAVLRHELSHGDFFTDPAYRAYCVGFWQHGLSEAQRQIFRRYLQSIDYDPHDEELMANETQALLMHTPDARAFNAAALGISEQALDALRIRFRANRPGHGLAASAAQKDRP